MANVEQVIIVGSGPAGYTAALYTARANLNPLVIEGFLWGGLLQQTTDVENYPGYPEGIMGPEMMQQFRDQAERFGTRFITDNVTKIEPGADGEPHTVWVDDEEYKARTVILAMGAEHKKLGVPGEEELGGRGVSYCATCDAAFYKDKTTMIVGGGDSAMEEALFLAKFSSRVTIVQPPRRVPRLEDHARARREHREHRLPDPVRRRGVRGRRDRRARRREAAQPRDGRAARPADLRRVHRDRPRAAVGARPGHRRDRRRTATSSPRASRRARRCRACSPPATSWTTPTARRSPPPAPGVSPRSTPSGTCATTRTSRRPTALKGTGDLAEAPVGAPDAGA